jgi:hypothetical protein
MRLSVTLATTSTHTIEVVEDIIVLVPVLPNNDAIITLVLSIVAFDVNIEVFIAHVLTIVTVIVRVRVIERLHRGHHRGPDDVLRGSCARCALRAHSARRQ